jgi:hypothetical protein
MEFLYSFRVGEDQIVDVLLPKFFLPKLLPRSAHFNVAGDVFVK